MAYLHLPAGRERWHDETSHPYGTAFQGGGHGCGTVEVNRFAGHKIY
jgi:hypothetical protein